MLAGIFSKWAHVVDLIHYIYASRATVALSEAAIQALLVRARARNESRGITGILLFIDGSFFQVLEGDPTAVDETYEAIVRDSRHDRVTQIIREPIARRSFGDWSMGFAAVERADAQRLVGENDFFGSAACLEKISAGRARKLLAAFAAGRWRVEQTGIHRAHARVGKRP
jgi:Sensors of blue-light using FAD